MYVFVQQEENVDKRQRSPPKKRERVERPKVPSPVPEPPPASPGLPPPPEGRTRGDLEYSDDEEEVEDKEEEDIGNATCSCCSLAAQKFFHGSLDPGSSLKMDFQGQLRHILGNFKFMQRKEYF